MTRELIFFRLQFKVNDKISLFVKFSNFLKPKIFRDTQISEPYILKSLDLQLEMVKKNLIFSSLGNLVTCKHYFQPTENFNLWLSNLRGRLRMNHLEPGLRIITVTKFYNILNCSLKSIWIAMESSHIDP